MMMMTGHGVVGGRARGRASARSAYGERASASAGGRAQHVVGARGRARQVAASGASGFGSRGSVGWVLQAGRASRRVGWSVGWSVDGVGSVARQGGCRCGVRCRCRVSGRCRRVRVGERASVRCRVRGCVYGRRAGGSVGVAGARRCRCVRCAGGRVTAGAYGRRCGRAGGRRAGVGAGGRASGAGAGVGASGVVRVRRVRSGCRRRLRSRRVGCVGRVSVSRRCDVRCAGGCVGQVRRRRCRVDG